MKNLLIQYKDNWADEMNVQGFHIMTEKAWIFFLKLVNDNSALFENDYTLGVGTNQEIPYSNKDDLLSRFTVSVISPVYAEQTKTLFNLPYGEFPLAQIYEGIAYDCDMSDEETKNNQWFADEIY